MKTKFTDENFADQEMRAEICVDIDSRPRIISRRRNECTKICDTKICGQRFAEKVLRTKICGRIFVDEEERTKISGRIFADEDLRMKICVDEDMHGRNLAYTKICDTKKCADEDLRRRRSS